MAQVQVMEAVVSGRVQGVFFRNFVVGHARRLGLTGYVRNLPDGTVGVFAEGGRDKLEQLELLLWQGTQAARVENVDVRWHRAAVKYAAFTVLY